MPDLTLPADLANNLWLYSRVAQRHVQDAIIATTEVDALVQQALEHSKDVDLIAAETFLDQALIEHIRAGGTSLSYFTQTTADQA